MCHVTHTTLFSGMICYQYLQYSLSPLVKTFSVMQNVENGVVWWYLWAWLLKVIGNSAIQ